MISWSSRYLQSDTRNSTSLLSVLRKAYRPRSHFPILSQFCKGHEKGQKKSSGFSGFDHTSSPKKHIEYHRIQTEKLHTIIFFVCDGRHYMAITEQYKGNLVFFWVSCKPNPLNEAQIIKKNKETWTSNARLRMCASSLRVLQEFLLTQSMCKFKI